ncbi:ferritin family protein [Marispirochaeta aestuarii]|uniref:ferritin family protein n=1 Tax=Marispirochaeta aestuarii TaxID=1963862 RepID=UPI0029C816A5|nr:ferritin family protein [Marispirochaeta aestuarii]
MKETILKLIDVSMNEYLRYRNSLEKPSLQRLMDTIIDQEREHKSEIEELEEYFFEGITRESMEEGIRSLSKPLDLKDDIAGLKDIMRREEAMADLFENLAGNITETEGRVFFTQYSLDERKHAGLVQSRLELESLT